MTWWKGLIAALIIAAVGGITFAGLREKPPPATEVQFGKVKKGPITRTVTGAGKVEAATTVKISSNLSGDLMELPVKVGDTVKKGQVLAKLDKRRVEASVRQASASWSAAKSEMTTVQVEIDRLTQELGRVKGLVEKGLASKAEQERAMSDLASARSRLASQADRAAQAAAVMEEAANNLSRTTLFSPIDGNVIEVTREVGERVRGSDFNEDVVMTLAALHTMEVKIEVGEHEVVHLILGQKSDIKIDAFDGQTFEGTVVEIAQKALIRNPGTEQETTSFPVTVALVAKPDRVLPGMSAEVKVTADQRDSALIVPVQAVTVRPERSLADTATNIEGNKLSAPKKGETFAKVVFVVDAEKKVHARRVKTGISSDTDIEILEGLSEGDEIIEGPYRTLAKDLKEGDLVEDQKAGGGKGPGGRGGKRG
ncbi:MAG: efflux RND transporter periplasmic adaptor subunit [Archangium sp.]|nr:efflux RND transporter periplasmic adaptor subunit [Archangium sp.]MDP3569587.1 efflux RND transporter periplasmic adaptor subunit [Archangium sp.]